MNQTIYIPFFKRLEPGESTFIIQLDGNHSEKCFELATVSLVPDNFSQQAIELGLEQQDAMLNELIADSAFYEVRVTDGIYFSYWFRPRPTPAYVPQLLQYLNNFAKLIKPRGFLLPPVIFDWIHIDAKNKSNKDAFQIHVNLSEELYGEKFDPLKHKGFLPENIIEIDNFFNNLKYPTNSEVLDKIRIRKTYMTNVSSYFVNDQLLKLLGFSEQQASFTTEINKAARFSGLTTNSRNVFVAENPPSRAKVMSATRWYVSPIKSVTRSPSFNFTTTAKNSRQPNLLVNDYNNSLKSVNLQTNLNLQLQFTKETNKFSFTFPQKDKAEVELHVPPKLAARLGYGYVSKIDRYTKNRKLPVKTSIKKVGIISKVQVYDTGMVFINLSQLASTSTQQYTNALVSVLEPKSGGYLSSNVNNKYSKFKVSQFNQTLEFVLSRFNETNEPVPLGWRTGAYVRGVLVSKS